MAKKKYTKEVLIKNLVDYYHKYNKVPTTREMMKEGCPNTHTYIEYFGSYKNALIEANLYDMRNDKSMFARRTYSDNELIDYLHKFVQEYGKVPFHYELDEKDDYPSSGTYEIRFGGYNKALIIAGLDINHFSEQRSSEALINELIQFYKQLGRTPTSRDIAANKNIGSENLYISRFGSLYTAYELANIPYKKRSRFYTDEEIISFWEDHKNNLCRIPSATELYDIDNKGIFFSIHFRWGNYYNFIKHLGLEDEYKRTGFKIYETTNGTRCSSYYELKITQWLEDNKINFTKEVNYRDVIESDSSMRRFDWVIENKNDTYFVEMFGIEGYLDYDRKRDAKIDTCKSNGVNLIEIYPEDLKCPLEEVFSFLFEDNRMVI